MTLRGTPSLWVANPANETAGPGIRSRNGERTNPRARFNAGLIKECRGLDGTDIALFWHVKRSRAGLRITVYRFYSVCTTFRLVSPAVLRCFVVHRLLRRIILSMRRTIQGLDSPLLGNIVLSVLDERDILIYDRKRQDGARIRLTVSLCISPARFDRHVRIQFLVCPRCFTQSVRIIWQKSENNFDLSIPCILRLISRNEIERAEINRYFHTSFIETCHSSLEMSLKYNVRGSSTSY